MKELRKWALAALIAAVPAVATEAQDEEAMKKSSVEAYIDFDLVSHYMWRGQDMAGVSIQPEAYVSWKGLTLRAEGSAGLDNSDLKELNVTLGYELGGFNIGVIDYWTSGLDPNDRYFHFEKQGAHQLEANLGFMCQYFSLQAYTVFWGNDFKISGKQAYSTYAEASVPFKLGGLDWSLAVGGTFFESAGYDEVYTINGLLGTETHYIHNYTYADGPACIMASLRATKTLDLGIAHLPVFAELHTNPYLQTAKFLVGLTFTPF